MTLLARLINRLRAGCHNRPTVAQQGQAKPHSLSELLTSRECAPRKSLPLETESDASTSPRKRILFVARSYPCETGDCQHSFILSGLRRDYDVITDRDLSMETAYLVRQMERIRPFDAVVTHVPFDTDGWVGMFGPGYTNSLSVLEDIRRLGDIPIIAYTGAEGMYSHLMWEYIDRRVSKTNNYQQDLHRIRESLHELLPHARVPFAALLPTIVRTEITTTVEARVNLRGGLGMTNAFRLADECGDYPGGVTIQRLIPAPTWTPVNVRDPIEVITSGLIEGCQALVTVEGTDWLAEHMTRRLYGILMTRHGCHISTTDSDSSKSTRKV